MIIISTDKMKLIVILSENDSHLKERMDCGMLYDCGDGNWTHGLMSTGVKLD